MRHQETTPQFNKTHKCRIEFLLLVLLLISFPLHAQDEVDLSNKTCMECHGDSDLTTERSGKEVSLFVDIKKFDSSVHAGLECVSCHSGISELPHEELLPVQCADCHDDISNLYMQSTHGKAHQAKIPDAPDCATCHGKHDILPPSDPASKTHVLNQIQICTGCHMNPEIATKYNLPGGEQIEAYKTSVHGRGVLRSGLLVSATCVDCHTAHKVLPKSDPDSSIYWSNIPKLCGTCHLGILEDFEKSTHGAIWAKKLPEGPGCITCHGSHGIMDPLNTEFHLKIPSICARCHENQAPTYEDTFHGQALSLGFLRAASCADCHTPHLNLKASDPNSSVHPDHLKSTCGKCHASVTASFLTFDPHVDPKRKESNPLLYYINLGMILLLTSVFGFFGFHDLLWLQRSIVGHFRGEFEKYHNGTGPWVQRFNIPTRIVHGFIIVSFLGLAFTGLPLKFHFTAWAVTLVNLLGGLEVFRFFHRFFAVITFGYAFYHISNILTRRFRRKEKGLFYGPFSMVPRPKDLMDLYHQVKWFLYSGPPPKLDRWTYWEKFDYFAVFWGVPVIGLSGLMLWFPAFFSSFLPGYFLNIAKIVHSEEALLAVGFIFIFHFFHTHLRPESFPMDTVIFTGSMPLERFRHERPEEYERLLNSNQLDSHLVEPPGPGIRRFAYIAGSIALTIGMLLVIAIIASVILYA